MAKMLKHNRPFTTTRPCHTHTPPFVHSPCSQRKKLHLQLAAVAVSSHAGQSIQKFSAAQAVEQLKSLCQSPELTSAKLQPKRFLGDLGERLGLVATQDIEQGQELAVFPEHLAITEVDAGKHELVGEVATQCSELTALTLWLMAERAKGPGSQQASLLQTLPVYTLTPLLWSETELNELLTGSPALAEARSRKAALQKQWQQLDATWFSQNRSRFAEDVFNEDSFMKAFSVVIAHAVYLPSAQCFALLPLASSLQRTGNENGADVDYDASRQAVVLKATRPFREGQEIYLNDGRPNMEMLLATGNVQENNLSDFLTFSAKLLPADRYYTMKSSILEQLGFAADENFPVYLDKFPNQLLAYLRLSRVADPALFAKVSFEQDVVLSQINEYEILQILMGDCREKLAVYPQSLEEDIKLWQNPNLGPKEKVAVKLRLGEKKIISAFMDAVRRKLAPIRGIPTKGGDMKDPNSDLKEIFDTIESIPTAPKKLLDGFLRWAKGEDDPDWGGKNKNLR